MSARTRQYDDEVILEYTEGAAIYIMPNLLSSFIFGIDNEHDIVTQMARKQIRRLVCIVLTQCAKRAIYLLMLRSHFR